MDIPRKWEDGLQAFEAALPGYWVTHGYAVIQPDPRGVFSSEGNILAWGSADADDCCDVIEWAATQPWSNGKVGLSGNSWLAMTQHFVAARRPAHLAAIAPWEGAADVYRGPAARGGIPDATFIETIFSSLFGNNLVEDVPAMMSEHPFMDAYWEDKVAKLENINIPAYYVGSWTDLLHTGGAFEAFQSAAKVDKWLRVHDTFEWTDYLAPGHVDNLRRFFDYFLKDIENGWRETPKVRLAVLDPGNRDIIDRAEKDFPLARQEIRSFYLSTENLEGVLIAEPSDVPSELAYDVSDREGISFKIKFDKATELTGYFNLKLWVEARGHNDMDIFAFVRKRDVNGEIQGSNVVTGETHIGANGRLRVSKRALDPARSTELRPYMPFTTAEKLSSGQIVPIEIGFWPYGIRWTAGETLELLITGTDLAVHPEFPSMPGCPTLNKGTHVIHFGGLYESRLLIPYIPLP